MSSYRRNIGLYPWFKFFQSLLFWQAVWFLFFQNSFSAAEALLLYAIYDLSTTVLEVPSGYISDRFGRRRTLITSAVAGLVAMICFWFGGTFAVFALGQFLFGASAAFVSGTDTSFLFESLKAEGRQDEVEAEELRAWRFTFTGFAASGFVGGIIALSSFEMTFAASAIAMAASLWVAIMFIEPPRHSGSESSGPESMRFEHLRTAFANPVLTWLFVLTVLMYGYSHIPFVFGQPFILESLAAYDLQGDAPVVSGTITALMMLVSLGTSLIAPKVRERLGLPVTLSLSFAIQIALAAVLAATNAVIAIVFLLLRMVPNSLSQPFILARIQPLLEDDSRATYLSIKSLVGRLLFAASLWLASTTVSDVDLLSYPELRLVLSWYVGVGLVCLIGLVVTATRIPIEDQDRMLAGQSENR
ncbi:MAG: MFS transporter [Boseongicola sp.]|nr:MFS transporter [Boseongicola sp.]MDD9976496.1 MFS transporter [Boseongicola sp.]